MTTKEQAKKYFEKNPTAQVVYGAGSFIFLEKKFAADHAATLDNQTVETIERETPEVTINVDFAKADYNQLKTMVTELKLEVADQKKETLIASLENYKNNL